MKNFVAITESGTKYDAHSGVVHITALGGAAYAIKPIQFSVFDRKTIMPSLDILDDLPNAELPEVGKSIYLASTTDWRLSTPIVSVVEHE